MSSSTPHLTPIFADRVDPGDRGGEYRSLLGLPGGTKHTSYPLVEEAAAKAGFKLVAGKGNDPDTFGKQIVFVYDTAKFPFYQAEVYHQVCCRQVIKSSLLFLGSFLLIHELCFSTLDSITTTFKVLRTEKPTTSWLTWLWRKVESRALVVRIESRSLPSRRSIASY